MQWHTPSYPLSPVAFFFLLMRCPLVLSAKLESLEDSFGAEDAISLSDIVPNVNKCSVSTWNRSRLIVLYLRHRLVSGCWCIVFNPTRLFFVFVLLFAGIALWETRKLKQTETKYWMIEHGGNVTIAPLVIFGCLGFLFFWRCHRWWQTLKRPKDGSYQFLLFF